MPARLRCRRPRTPPSSVCSRRGALRRRRRRHPPRSPRPRRSPRRRPRRSQGALDRDGVVSRAREHGRRRHRRRRPSRGSGGGGAGGRRDRPRLLALPRGLRADGPQSPRRSPDARLAAAAPRPAGRRPRRRAHRRRRRPDARGGARGARLRPGLLHGPRSSRCRRAGRPAAPQGRPRLARDRDRRRDLGRRDRPRRAPRSRRDGKGARRRPRRRRRVRSHRRGRARRPRRRHRDRRPGARRRLAGAGHRRPPGRTRRARPVDHDPRGRARHLQHDRAPLAPRRRGAPSPARSALRPPGGRSLADRERRRRDVRGREHRHHRGARPRRARRGLAHGAAAPEPAGEHRRSGAPSRRLAQRGRGAGVDAGARGGPHVILLTAAAGGSRVYWFLTRSTGAVALVLLTASVLLGLLGTLRLSGRNWPRYTIEALHRDVSLLVLAVLVVHIVTTVLDSFAPIGLPAAVIPFISSYRPFWLGLGALAFDLLLAVTITSLVRRRLGYARWRAVHWLAYASWPIAVLHGLGTGSDTRLWWMLALTAACVAAVAAAVCARLARAERSVSGVRVPGIAVCAGVAVGLAVFTISGPMQRGWARRAGTPRRLLAHPAAQLTRVRVTPTGT